VDLVEFQGAVLPHAVAQVPMEHAGQVDQKRV
jgi:hypothetical protein